MFVRAAMKFHMSVTIDAELLRKIDELRGLTKRSTFVEQLLKLAVNLEVEKKRKKLKDYDKLDRYQKTLDGF